MHGHLQGPDRKFKGLGLNRDQRMYIIKQFWLRGSYTHHRLSPRLYCKVVLAMAVCLSGWGSFHHMVRKQQNPQRLVLVFSQPGRDGDV